MKLLAHMTQLAERNPLMLSSSTSQEQMHRFGRVLPTDKSSDPLINSGINVTKISKSGDGSLITQYVILYSMQL